MLGGKFKFVELQNVKGEGAKGPYHFANVTLSDGLESIELSADLALIPTLEQLKRGQDIQVTTSVRKNGYNHNITVKRVQTV